MLLRSPKDIVKREVRADTQVGMAVIHPDGGYFRAVESYVERYIAVLGNIYVRAERVVHAFQRLVQVDRERIAVGACKIGIHTQNTAHKGQHGIYVPRRGSSALSVQADGNYSAVRPLRAERGIYRSRNSTHKGGYEFGKTVYRHFYEFEVFVGSKIAQRAYVQRAVLIIKRRKQLVPVFAQIQFHRGKVVVARGSVVIQVEVESHVCYNVRIGFKHDKTFGNKFAAGKHIHQFAHVHAASAYVQLRAESKVCNAHVRGVPHRFGNTVIHRALGYLHIRGV